MNLILLDTFASDLVKNALSLNIEVFERPTYILRRSDLENIISDLSKGYRVDKNLAYVALCVMLQVGGSITNKKSNIRIRIDNTQFESRRINIIIMKHCKNLTPRQFARQIANDIFLVSERYQIPGNAYLSLVRQYSHFLVDNQTKDKFWASDFQVDNPNCPKHIRQALRTRYNDKFMRRK